MSPGLLLLGDIWTSQSTNYFQGTLGTYGHLSVRTASRGRRGHTDISLYERFPEGHRGHTDITVYELLPEGHRGHTDISVYERLPGDIQTSFQH